MSEHYEQPEEHKVSELPESFFVPIADKVEDFFDQEVVSTINAYIATPNIFSSVEEILILDKIDQARHFLKAGCELNKDVSNFVEIFEVRRKDDSFEFNSELGKEYANYLFRIRILGKILTEKTGLNLNDENKEERIFSEEDYRKISKWIGPKLDFEDPFAFTSPSPETSKADEEFKYLVSSRGFRSFVSYLIKQGNGDYQHSEELSASLFVAWLAHETPETFKAHRKTIQNYAGDKKQLVSAFLATEFGDDFGDRIIEIAEHAQPNEAEKIFEIINAFREESAFFAKMYEPFDTELARATEKAMNERLADLIVVAEHVARDGAMTVDVSPGRDAPDYVYDGSYDIRIESIDHVINTMQQLLNTLVRRREIVEATSTKVSRVVANSEELGYQIYRFHNQDLGDALLHIRPEGAGDYDKAFEYGNYDGVEASISWVVNPAGDYRLASDKDPDGVSIRFDREGRRVDEAPNSPERSSIREDGSISLDLSSGVGKKRAAPVQIGRIIAAGNILRAEEEGTAVSLHHNTNFFDQAKYGSATGFKELANYMSIMAEALIQSQRSKKAGKKVVAVAGA